MENFHSLNLPKLLNDSLKEMGFIKPTPVQAETIPLALKGHDILGTAQTGTGKTGAFGIPLVSYVINNPNNSALVLTPTRELALQVSNVLKDLIGRSSIRVSLLIGGEPIIKQLNQLKGRPQIIVGTPGRVNDHLSRGSLKINNTGFIVLDETDRMLDMGFSIQLKEIAKFLPAKRQTLMFSATMDPNIIKAAQSYLKDEIRVSVGSTTTAIDKIKQEVLHTSDGEKYDLLLNQLKTHNGSCIVFVKTKIGTEKLAKRLRESKHSADAIHGDLRQRSRDQVIKSFRDQKSRILVATDIAARGLDIPHIECVVNYDLPMCPEDYIHRIGRTGRADKEGKAVSLITSQDKVRWRSICKLMNPNEKFEDERTPAKKKRFSSHANSNSNSNAKFGAQRRTFSKRAK